MEQLNNLCFKLNSCITNVTKNAIGSKNSYEKALCKTFNFEVQNERYWDAFCKETGLYLEFKKCTGMIWMDQVRYVEIKNKLNKNANVKTFTLIFFYSKSQKFKEIITQIAVIDTDKLINRLFENYPDQLLDSILENYKLSPRGLNSQASLSKKDLILLADRVIEHPKFIEENVKKNRKRLLKDLKKNTKRM